MTKLDYIKALQAISGAISEIIGALKADYFKDIAKPYETAENNGLKIEK